MLKEKDKEKEQAEKLKALRRELEEKIEEQLPFGILDEKMRVEVQKINEGESLDPVQAKGVIEALLFASSHPVTVQEIRRAVKSLVPKQIEGVIEELKNEYAAQDRSFEIHEVAGGYEIATRKKFAPWILKIELQKKARQVTQSALETLAILAYKQPVTKAEIEDLRGVDASGVMGTLVERGLIKIVGKKEVPGRPFLYGTTEKFLEHFGLKALGDLPNIDEIKTLVENSVKKDELLGTQKIVDIPAEPSEGESGPQEPSEDLLSETSQGNQEQDGSESAAR